jgi:hypothetical protein
VTFDSALALVSGDLGAAGAAAEKCGQGPAQRTAGAKHALGVDVRPG